VLDGYEMLTLNLCKTDAGRGMILYIENSSIVAILELIRGAQCLNEVIRSSGEEM
jgi:hypothetical protein